MMEAAKLVCNVGIAFLKVDRQERVRIHNVFVDQIRKKTPFSAIRDRCDCHFRRGVVIA